MITEDALKKKFALSTILYRISSTIAGGTGVALVTSEVATILGIGLILFGVATLGWSCVVGRWFFK